MWPARATIGRQALQMHDISEGFFMQPSRRGFLVGLGSVLTTAFVAEATTFVRATCAPLLVQPSEVRQTLYWYLPDGSHEPMFCLDASPYITPLPPTWCEFLKAKFQFLRRPATFEETETWRRCYKVEPDQLDLPMDAAVWQREFDGFYGPHGRA